MKQIIYNAQTKQTTFVEVPDEEMPVFVEPLEAEIQRLKSQLSETDYKIIKCSEYQLAGLQLPYDIVTLHTERQAIRDRINELE